MNQNLVRFENNGWKVAKRNKNISQEFLERQQENFDNVLETIGNSEERRERIDERIRGEIQEINDESIKRERDHLEEERLDREREREELKSQIEMWRNLVGKSELNHRDELKKQELKNEKIFLYTTSTFVIGCIAGMLLKNSHLTIVIILLIAFIYVLCKR